jgi:hypothetical protein
VYVPGVNEQLPERRVEHLGLLLADLGVAPHDAGQKFRLRDPKNLRRNLTLGSFVYFSFWSFEIKNQNIQPLFFIIIFILIN